MALFPRSCAIPRLDRGLARVTQYLVARKAGSALTSSAAPQLEGDARAAVLHRGSHLQIIASAGSGKTEVVAQRFAQLMADGADPARFVTSAAIRRRCRRIPGCRGANEAVFEIGSGAHQFFGPPLPHPHS
jgi:UvrD/REP helicase N-terminal domain